MEDADSDGEELSADFQELMGKTVEEILKEGQKVLFAKLVSICRSGLASHQHMAVLRNILKDNGLTLGIPPEQPQRSEAPVDLPNFGKPEYLQ